MYGIVIKNKIITAKNFIKKLKAKNIEARPFFYGLHMQNILKKIVKKNSKCANTEYISKYGFYIPSGLNINKKELNTVSSTVNNLINNI
jgi:perosamine synthetase